MANKALKRRIDLYILLSEKGCLSRTMFMGLIPELRKSMVAPEERVAKALSDRI